MTLKIPFDLHVSRHLSCLLVRSENREKNYACTVSQFYTYRLVRGYKEMLVGYMKITLTWYSLPRWIRSDNPCNIKWLQSLTGLKCLSSGSQVLKKCVVETAWGKMQRKRRKRKSRKEGMEEKSAFAAVVVRTEWSYYFWLSHFPWWKVDFLFPISSCLICCLLVHCL